MKKSINWKDILLLQGVFFVYSITSLAQKAASEYFPKDITSFADLIAKILNWDLILRIALVVFLLGVYAVLWQQVIKRFELSIAYANKSVTLLWALIWGLLIFHETITVPKVIGIAVVIIGICVLNSKEKEKEAVE